MFYYVYSTPAGESSKFKIEGGIMMFNLLIGGICLVSGVGSLYKFAQALFGNKKNCKKNMLIFTLAYAICVITYQLFHLI